MAPDTLAELLDIDPATPRPSVYQLFGLNEGETDAQTIATAIRGTLRRLKASKANSDPKVWKQAAAAVTKARKILTDPSAKAAYDAKRLHRLRGDASDDPLQGLLPPGDPLAPFDPAAAAERVPTLGLPKPTLPHPAASTPTPPIDADAVVERTPAEPPAVASPLPSDVVVSTPSVFDVATGPTIASTSANTSVADSGVMNLEVPAHDTSRLSLPDVDTLPVGKPPSRRRRRRGFPWVAVVLTVMVVAMLGGIGLGIFLLTSREQRPVAARDTTTPEELPQVSPPPLDPVLGRVANETEAPPGNLLSADEVKQMAEMSGETNPQPQEPPEEMPADVPESEPVPEPPPMAVEPAGQPDEAAQRAGQAAIDAASQAIVTNDWAEMKALAAKAVEAASGDEQKARAERLFQLADLADYYYTGLMQSLEKLEAGNQLELENVGIVGVIEANETTFAIQVNSRPKSFDFNKIPFFVVDAIAAQSMDLSDPMTQAAKAVHQAISVNATPEHRRQSLGWLAALPDSLQDVEPDALQQAIRELYPNL